MSKDVCGRPVLGLQEGVKIFACQKPKGHPGGCSAWTGTGDPKQAAKEQQEAGYRGGKN